MAHAILSPTVYANEALRILEGKLGISRMLRPSYKKEFAQKGQKIGYTVRIKKPNRFQVSEGAALSPQDIAQEYVSLTVDKQRHIDTTFTSAEWTMELNEWSKDIGEPAMAKLAAKIDYECHDVTEGVGNFVGTHGTTPATALVVGQAKAKILDCGGNDDNLKMLCNPLMGATILDALKALPEPAKTISGQNFKGSMGHFWGMDWVTSPQVKNHTCGTYNANFDMNGATAEGAETLVVDTGTGTVLKGDLFEIAAVNPTNPGNDQTLQWLQTFACTTSQAGNATSIPIQLALRSTGAYKTVGALPADGASLVFKGTAGESYPYNILFDPDFATVCFVDLDMPRGVWGARASHNGMSIRMIDTYDPQSDKMVTRFDVLFGYALLYPQLACLLPGESRT